MRIRKSRALSRWRIKQKSHPMKIRYILAAFLLSAVSVSGVSQSNSRASRAHSEAHKAQLANAHKSKIDKSVVKDFVRGEVLAREQKRDLSSESSALVSDLLKEANKHIGKRYVHGAKGPSAFDCSGFSSYVYRQFGYTLSPSSKTQFTQGTPVEKGDLRKGDLVFFTSRSSGRNVGHVGIVVSADNEKGTFKFIHASIKGVKVSEYEGYYVPRYLGARRIINE